MLFTSSTGEIISIPNPSEKDTQHIPTRRRVKEKASTGYLENMAPSRTKVRDFDVSIEQVPVTEQRRAFIQNAGDEKLLSPGTARANEAASVESPDGTTRDDWAHKHRHQAVLQQHLAFFDTDSGGVIWPIDTFRGFYRLGYGILLSILSVLIIHSNFSYPTVKGWLPDPFFRIYTERIHKDKHGSDSGTYDTEGRFVPQKFEDIFAEYASGDKQSLTFNEMLNYMQGKRLVLDPFGWGGAIFEWIATYILIARDGRMYKDDIRRIYDGSIFYEIAARREKKKA